MIPNTAHFVWLGRDLPWLARLGPVSAARRGGFDRVVLHHEPDLDPSAIRFLADRIGALEVRQIPSQPETWCALGPTARANLLRLRILREEGGVYLDMDTVTVASFAPLRDAGFFCGTEAVVFSSSLRRSRNPAKWTAAVAKTSLRRICRWLPGGWRLFRRLERYYEHRPNNAVLGAIPGHPLVVELASRAARMAGRPRIRPKDLGVRLLQERLADPAFAARTDIALLGPDRFYPLPPDIAAHWFRSVRRIALSEMLSAETRCVHWYASLVGDAARRASAPSWIAANRDRIPLARLVADLDLPL